VDVVGKHVVILNNFTWLARVVNRLFIVQMPIIEALILMEC